MISTWLSLCAIHLLGVMSPGPDFLIVFKNASLFSRRDGILTSLGIVSGNGIHIVTVLAGSTLILARHPEVMSWIQITGLCYLGWLGIKSLGSKPRAELGAQAAPRTRSAFAEGFITSLLNPKALVYFATIASQFVRPELALPWLMLLVLTMLLISGTWFSLVALLVGSPAFRARLNRMAHWIDRACGVVLLSYVAWQLPTAIRALIQN